MLRVIWILVMLWLDQCLSGGSEVQKTASDHAADKAEEAIGDKISIRQKGYIYEWALGLGGNGLIGGAGGEDRILPAVPTIPPRKSTGKPTDTPTKPSKPTAPEAPFVTKPPAPTKRPRPPPGPQGKDEVPPAVPNAIGRLPLCMDLMIVIDVSCSVETKWRELARDRVAMLIENLAIETQGASIRVAMLSYSLGIAHGFYLDEMSDPVVIRDKLRTVPLVDGGCRTHTHTALDRVLNEYLTPQHGDRPDHPDVLLLFTDGRTIKRKYQKVTLRNAQLVKDAGIEINVITMPNRKAKSGRMEFDAIPSTRGGTGDRLLYHIDEEESMEAMLDTLATYHHCPKVEAEFKTCVDIVFAFDFSCSIEDENKQREVDIAKDFVNQVTLSYINGASVGAFSFDSRIQNKIPFSTDGDVNRLADQLSTVNQKAKRCRTKTHMAIREAVSRFDEKRDRPDDRYPDLLIMFGDGVTFPWKMRQFTIENAEDLKSNAHVMILWIKFPNKSGKDATEIEIEKVASPNSRNIAGLPERLVFQYDDEDIFTKFQLLMDSYFPCLGEKK